jgi:hypothetical protein
MCSAGVAMATYKGNFRFGGRNAEKFTYAVRGHAVDLLSGDNEEDEEATK